MHIFNQAPDPKIITRQNTLVFLLILSALAGFVWWQLSHHFASDLALQSWNKILTVFDAFEFRIENLSMLQPHMPLYLLIPFYYLPAEYGYTAPYFTSAFCSALLLALWNHDLKQRNYTAVQRGLLILLVAIHPFFLWAMTGGAVHGLTLLVFYLFCIASIRLTKYADARAFLMMALVLISFFFVDELAFFVFIAFFPMVQLLVPRRMIDESPMAVYLLVAVPLIVAVLTWLYLNNVFASNAYEFLENPYGSFRGSWLRVENVEWLRLFGGKFLTPTLLAIGLLLVAFPVSIWMIWRARRHTKILAGIAILVLNVALAVGFGSASYYLSHPIEIMSLMVPGIMAALILMPREFNATNRFVLYVMLALSVAGGWYAMNWKPTHEMRNWLSMFTSGEKQPPISGTDEALGKWLKENRGVTLIDDNVAYRAIVARGDAKDLMVPFTKEFQLALRSENLTELNNLSTLSSIGRAESFKIEQVVVQNPVYSKYNESLASPEIDMLTRRYPNLYAEGIVKKNVKTEGATVTEKVNLENSEPIAVELVYDDHVNWRVWRFKYNEELHRNVVQCIE